MATALKRFFRIDAVGELAKPVRQANGWLKVDGKIARTGLQEYEDTDGTTHMELRLPEEVFDPDSMASFQMVPYTNTHPPVLLDDQNTSQYQRGHVGENVRQLDDTWLGAPILITDAATIRDVEAGRNQLSNGYSAELDPTQNADLTAKWGTYKFIQRKIRGNHVAGVDSARAGPEARVRLDNHGDALIVSAPREDTPMKTIRIDGIELELTDGNSGAIQAAIEKVLQRTDQARVAAEGRLTELTETHKIVRDNACSLLSDLKRVRSVVDGKKGKLAMLEADEEGNVTMHLPGGVKVHMPTSKATGIAEGEADDKDVAVAEEDPDGDDDMDSLEEATEGAEDMDEDELETEQETEGESGKAKKDAAARRAKARADSLKFAKGVVLTINSRIDGGIKARTALEGVARRFLDASTDISKLDAVGIRRAVVEKLSPTTKLDGKSPTDIKARFDALVELAGDAPSGSDLARSLVSPFVANRTQVTDAEEKEDGSHLTGRDRMIFQQKLDVDAILSKK